MLFLISGFLSGCIASSDNGNSCISAFAVCDLRFSPSTAFGFVWLEIWWMQASDTGGDILRI